MRKQQRSRGAMGWGVIGAVGIVASVGAAAPSVNDPGQGPVAILDPLSTGVNQLSGLAYPQPLFYSLPAGVASNGGPTFFAVSDSADRAAELSIDVDTSTAFITGNGILAGPSIGKAGADFEGMVFTFDASNPSDVSLALVDEGDASITVYGVPDVAGSATPAAARYPNPDFGSVVQNVPVPVIYQASQPGFGLESLAFAAGFGPGTGRLYTANEQPLTPDPATTTATSGGRVRVQQFVQSPTFAAGKQVAFELEGNTGFPEILGSSRVAANGVVDLLALPDGSLIVLERALGVTGLVGLSPTLETRTTISLITPAAFSAADDTSGLAALDGTESAATKMVLFQDFFGDQNYEGLALGEALDEATFGPGAYSLLLISDDGQLSQSVPIVGTVTFSPQQTLLPLVIRDVAVPEPTSGGAMLAGVGVLATWWRGRR